jgi:hypothetical protein
VPRWRRTDDGGLQVSLPEAVTASGTRIELSDGLPSVDIDYAATYTKILPTGAATEITFEVPTAGLYDVQFMAQPYCSLNASGQYKLVFDEAEVNEQAVGDSLLWQHRCITDQYEAFVFPGQVELTAGTHTVTAYAKELSGTLQILTNAFPTQAPTIVLNLVTGSGAGGVLAEESVIALASEPTVTAIRPALADVPGLSITVDCSIGEPLLLKASGWALNTVVDTLGIGFAVDGTLLDGIEQVASPQTFSGAASAVIAAERTYVATATQHTITLQAGHNAGTMTIKHPTRLEVVRARGGLVPVYDSSGALVQDKPASWRFIGSTVTNDGGQVIVNTPTGLSQDTVSVKDELFGALGDGATDDSTAIQAAIDYAVTNKRNVYFPEGTYIVNTQLTVDSLFAPNLIGAGWGRSEIRAGAAIRLLSCLQLLAISKLMACRSMETVWRTTAWSSEPVLRTVPPTSRCATSSAGKRSPPTSS